MLTHSCLQRSGVERNSTWERRKKKIQFLNKTKSSEVPVFFQARDIQTQALHLQMSQMWGVWNCELKSMSCSSNSSCQKKFFGCTLKAKGLSNFCSGTKDGNVFIMWQLRRKQNQAMIMTLKAICGYDGNIYGNGGTVEFGLLFSELELAWTRKSRVPFQSDNCRMLQSFLRIYDTSSLSDFK